MGWYYCGRLRRRKFVATLHECMRDKDDTSSLSFDMNRVWHSGVAAIVLDVPVIPAILFRYKTQILTGLALRVPQAEKLT